jgi:hypothetical protein
MNNDRSIDDVRRIGMEIERSTHEQLARLIVHLCTDDETLDSLTIDITDEQAEEMFKQGNDLSLYFLHGIDERTIIHSMEIQLKQLFTVNNWFLHDKYRRTELLTTIDNVFHAYAHCQLTNNSRQECMRIGLDYGFAHCLTRMNSDEFRSITDHDECHRLILTMINDLQQHWQEHMERRAV